jgi:iron(III) transport system substrate-binding protein
MEMNKFGKLLTIVLLIAFLTGCGTPAPTATEAPKPADNAAPQATDVPPTAVPTLTAKEEWAMANQLGPYSTDTQDWAAIEEAAKKEGKVVVYANSSKIGKAAEAWAELYPEIAIDAYDLGGDDVLSKTLGEQQSGTIVGDVWASSGGAEVVGTVMPNEYVWSFVPDTIAMPEEYTKPLLLNRFGTWILAYNSELNESCPVTNLWELTQPEWKGKIVIEDPLNDASTLSKLLTLVSHPDVMKQAYVDLYGSEPTLDADTPDAGWLWFKRLAQNAPIPEPGGDEVDSAFATPGMKENLLAFTSYSNYADALDGNLAFEPCWGVNPKIGIQSQSYLGIMNQAPHPNAAKLFIRFMGTEEGRKPWAKFGTYFADPAYEVPEGQMPLDDMMKISYLIDEQYAFDNLIQARDFWLLNLGTP